MAADGTFEFAAPHDLTGTFTFRYALRNVVDASEAASTITIVSPPYATNDVYLGDASSRQGTSWQFESILQNDNLGHPYGTITSFGGGTLGGDVTDHAPGNTVSPIPGYVDGALAISGEGHVELTPPTDFEGDFLFQYTLTNSRGSSVGDVLVDLTILPAAMDDQFFVQINGQLAITESVDGLLSNDDHGMPTASLASYGGGMLGGASTDHVAGETIAPLPGFDDGSLTVNADGTLDFDSPTDFMGAFTLEYVLENSEGRATAIVVLDAIEPRAPEAVDDNYTATQNSAFTVAAGAGGILDNDDLGFPMATLTEIFGGNLEPGGMDYEPGEVISPIPGFPDGSLVVHADGGFDFTPPTDFLGPFMFDYEIQNSEGTGMGWVTIHVEPGGPKLHTLVTGLEYPKGLWVRDGNVYVTETAGRNTAFGGKIRLSRYTVGTGELATLLDDPVNSDAVVVGGDGSIYLASYQGSIPGEVGNVSVVDPSTLIESPIVTLGVAADDMFLDSNEDIYVSGSSDAPTGTSLNLLPIGDYTNVTVLEEGLGRITAMTKVGPDIYFLNAISDVVSRRDATGTITQVVVIDGSGSSLTPAGSYIYFTDFSGGSIGRFQPLVPNPEIEIVVTGLATPLAVRYDAMTESLYFLEGGTAAGEFKDGTLGVITNLPEN